MMTSRQRSAARVSLTGLGLISAMIVYATVLGGFRDAALAQPSQPPAIATPHIASHEAPAPTPAPTEGSAAVVESSPRLDAGSEPQPTSTATATPATSPAASNADVGLATKLWRSGAFLAAGIITLYLLLTLGFKLDKKHAFYWSSGLGVLTPLADLIVQGGTLTTSALVVAVTTLVGILVKGPEKGSGSP